MDEVERQLKNRAFGLLSRREHSRQELVTKLTVKGAAPERVARVVDQLQDSGLQSDDRYAEVLVRSLVARGQGPLRIMQTLRSKGVAAELAASVLEQAEVDWFERAVAVQKKRFGDGPGNDAKLRARQLRFLLYRGFDQEQARHALEQAQLREREAY